MAAKQESQLTADILAAIAAGMGQPVGSISPACFDQLLVEMSRAKSDYMSSPNASPTYLATFDKVTSAIGALSAIYNRLSQDAPTT